MPLGVIKNSILKYFLSKKKRVGHYKLKDLDEVVG